ncbi:MAG: nucleoside deaminase [Gemmatimonadota bacterium]
MSEAKHEEFLREAIRLAAENVEQDGGPFGAVVVKDGEIVARGVNRVTAHNDPTAHAEIVAIREACRALGTFQLEGCTIYCSTEPCPMCLGAIYWARPDAVYFAAAHADAAENGFDDQFIYAEIAQPVERRTLPTRRLAVEGALEPFRCWRKKENRVEY